MIEVYVLLIVCSILAIVYTKTLQPAGQLPTDISDASKKGNIVSAFVLFIMICILVWFIGLRSAMNDTLIYAKNFGVIVPKLSEIGKVDWNIGNNPLFITYQIIFKTFISKSASSFIFITSLIVVVSYVLFIKKYSPYFSLSIYVMIASTTYAFVGAAMKQTLAMSIAIWAVPLFLRKKYVRSLLIFAVASLIHPYVLVLLIGLFFRKDIWDKRTIAIIAATAIVFFAFSGIIEGILSFSSSLGDTYNIEEFSESQGVNFFRVVFYLILPILSFVYRENLRERDSQLLNICVNMSLLAACFMTLASLGAANLIGRVANYFDLFNCITAAFLFKYGIKNEADRKLAVNLYIIALLVFYSYYYYNYFAAYNFNWTASFYGRISIFSLLSNW